MLSRINILADYTVTIVNKYKGIKPISLFLVRISFLRQPYIEKNLYERVSMLEFRMKMLLKLYHKLQYISKTF